MALKVGYFGDEKKDLLFAILDKRPLFMGKLAEASEESHPIILKCVDDFTDDYKQKTVKSVCSNIKPINTVFPDFVCAFRSRLHPQQ